MKVNTTYSLCPKRFKYVYDYIDKFYLTYEEINERVDKIVLKTFAQDTLEGIKEDIKKNNYGADTENWDVVHLDGDIHNNRLDNLEFLFFTEDDPILEKADKFEDEVIELKNEIKSLNNTIQEYRNLLSISKNREEIANKKLESVSKTNAALNKEILAKEKEINKYWHLLNDK